MTNLTEKQLEANRQNAKLGGVKTETGKNVSKFNALKHGLLSKKVLLEKENEETLVALGKKIRSEVRPQTEVEEILTDRIVSNIWRLRRALTVEREAMDFHKKNGLEEDDILIEYSRRQKERKANVEMITNGDLERITRYETTIERSIYKALHELQRIQSARAGEKPLAPVALDVDVTLDK